MSILISPEELARRIQSGTKETILAVLWYKDGISGKQQFTSQHIPTALFCDAARALAGTPSSTTGRNPLPTTDNLQRWFDAWGLQPNRPIIAYDNNHGLFAARAWWTLRWAGVTNVSILNGGQGGWEEAGEALLGGPGNIAQVNTIEPRPGQLPTATEQEVKEFTGLLIDAREPKRFAGAKEHLDLKAGHIPGAINIPASSVVNDDSTFKSPEEIRAIFEEKKATNIEDMIIYSGSGNHSSLVIAAMEYAGLGIPNHYVGGWSQWCANPKNPVETGFGE